MVLPFVKFAALHIPDRPHFNRAFWTIACISNAFDCFVCCGEYVDINFS
jgi:hypothetical protein